MPIFTVSTKHPENDDPLKDRIISRFPEDHYEFGRGQWLVSYSGTAQELFGKLFPEAEFPLPAKGVTIFGMAGYYGMASRDMWDWVANKLTAKVAI